MEPKIKKKPNLYGVNIFIEQAIQSAIEVNRTAFAEGKPFTDACWQIVFSIDTCERIARGCGILEMNDFYKTELAELTAQLDKETFDSSSKSSDAAIRAVKRAQARFELLIKAVKNNEHSEFDLAIGPVDENIVNNDSLKTETGAE
jgi:hypothetical protein